MKKYCYICVAAFLQWVLVACTDLQETINNDNPVAAVVHADIASDSYTGQRIFLVGKLSFKRIA